MDIEGFQIPKSRSGKNQELNK